MKALDAVRRLFLDQDRKPTSSQISSAIREVVSRRDELQSRIDELRRSRVRLLVTGTTEELIDHDELTKRTERDISLLEERLESLYSRRTAAIEREAIEGLPGQLLEVEQGIRALQEIEAKALALREELTELVSKVSHDWVLVRNKHNLPKIPPDLADDVRALLGSSLPEERIRSTPREEPTVVDLGQSPPITGKRTVNVLEPSGVVR